MKNTLFFLALLLGVTSSVFAGSGNVAKPDTVNGWYFWKAEGENQDSTWTYLTDSAIVGKSSQVFGVRSYGRPNRYFWVKKLDHKYKKPTHADFWVWFKSFSSPGYANSFNVKIFLGNSEKLSDIVLVEGGGQSRYDLNLKYTGGFGTTNFKEDSLDVIVFVFSTNLLSEKVVSEIAFDDIVFIYEDGKTITIEDGGEPKFASLKVAKPKVNFGAVATGIKRIDSVLITNIGDAPLVISKVWTDNARFSAKCSSMTIAPRASTNVVVEFTQDSIPGVKKGKLFIEHNAPSKKDSIELTADYLVLASTFRTAQTKINFGAVASGIKKSDSVLVSNIGNIPLVISKIWTSDSAFSAKCSVNTINQQSSASIQVEFTQDSIPVAKHGWLYIKHNGLNKLDSIELTADYLVLFPNLKLEKTKINFGILVQGSKKTDSILITNLGEAPLVISKIWTDNPAFSAECSVLTVAPQDSITVLVEFLQDSVSGLKNGKLYIEHNAVNKLDSVVLTADFMTSVGDENHLPKEFSLSQNYPNPFNPSTTIKYSIESKQFVRIVIYDLLGKEVVVLVDEEVGAGEHSVVFDAKNLSSGTYLYRIQAGNFIATKRMMLLK
jgi:hypothetical protein